MAKLKDLATMLRSKNSGPFLITLDILFDTPQKYLRAKNSKALTKENILKLYKLKEEDLKCIVFFDSALGIKITYNRQTASGTVYDRDVYGAQQHAPLLDLEIE